MADEPTGREIQIDENAVSADPSLHAFVVLSDGGPIYCEFPILHDVEVDRFKMEMISGFGGEWSDDDGMDGDAFVVAPDNSRCGLVWDVGGKVLF